MRYLLELAIMALVCGILYRVYVFVTLRVNQTIHREKIRDVSPDRER